MMAAAVGVDSYYQGSRVFWWLSDFSGLQIDQVNFVLSQFVALILGYVLRVYLHPSKVSTNIRHVYCFTVGIAMLYFCFGNYVVYILIQAVTSYAILRMLSPKTFQRYVMIFALSYLSLIHLLRQIYNYGSYTLDITGPLMVITQKVTSLAFCLHDGSVKGEKKLNDDQKKQCVKEVPSFVVYMGYCFQFQTLMCGPLIFYKDYLVFIAGEQYRKYSKINGIGSKVGVNGIDHKMTANVEPNPNMSALKKVAESMVYALMLLFCLPYFPIKRLLDDNFVENSSFLSMMFYLSMATMFVRTKYYHAWSLADGICNMSGLGFTGYDEKGVAKWDGSSNVNPLRFETAASVRVCLDNWNRCTGLWLRRVAYDRAPYPRTLFTYCLSAIWHGFYPGYYVTFLTGAVFTEAARKCRRAFRPYFQTSKRLAFIYDIITFLVTRVSMAYCTFPFVLLQFWPSMRIYRSMFFYVHIGTIAFFFIPSFIPLHESVKNKQTDSSSNGTPASNGKNMALKSS